MTMCPIWIARCIVDNIMGFTQSYLIANNFDDVLPMNNINQCLLHTVNAHRYTKYPVVLYNGHISFRVNEITVFSC